MKPAAYRWRWSKGQSWQLAHTRPRPIQKMGRLRPQPDVEPLYDAMTVIQLECVIRFMCDRLRKLADTDMDAKSAFEHGEDYLAGICTNQT